MYSIDGTNMDAYGLIVSEQTGAFEIPGLKEQFFSVYGQEGYQMVKFKANILRVDSYVIATGLADLKAKLEALNNLFMAPGLRTIILDDDDTAFDVFAKEGAKVERVTILSNAAFARYSISLDIVAQYSTVAVNVFTNVFTDVFGIPEGNPSAGIFNNVFSNQFN